LSLELLDPTRGVDELQLAREKRMTGTANVDLQLLAGAACGEAVSATTVDVGLVIFGMNAFFHGLPTPRKRAPGAQGKHGQSTRGVSVKLVYRKPLRISVGMLPGKCGRWGVFSFPAVACRGQLRLILRTRVGEFAQGEVRLGPPFFQAQFDFFRVELLDIPVFGI